MNGAVPPAVTENVAGLPARTLTGCGWAARVGACGSPVTTSVNGALVAVPAAFVTTTSKVAPLSAATVAGVV